MSVCPGPRAAGFCGHSGWHWRRMQAASSACRHWGQLTQLQYMCTEGLRSDPMYSSPRPAGHAQLRLRVPASSDYAVATATAMRPGARSLTGLTTQPVVGSHGSSSPLPAPRARAPAGCSRRRARRSGRPHRLGSCRRPRTCRTQRAAACRRRAGFRLAAQAASTMLALDEPAPPVCDAPRSTLCAARCGWCG